MSRIPAAAVIEKRWGSVTRKTIALVLADHTSAQDNGEWVTLVGQKRIANEAEVSERTVRSVLAEFESEGLVTRQARFRKEGRGRTSDRIVLVQTAINDLPEAASGGNSGTNRQLVHDQPEADARLTGKAVAGHDPPEEPPVEPPAAELPAIRWARRWAELRQVTFSDTIKRNWSKQVQELIRADADISEALLRQALTEGIREPKAWAYVDRSKVAEAERAEVHRDCSECKGRGFLEEYSPGAGMRQVECSAGVSG